MGNVMAYSGLTTKIRAMQAKLLTQADYETISGFTDVVQVVEFLKTKPAYAVYMDQLELAHLHRGDIEKMLYQSLYNDYTRIFRFAGIDQKKFLKIYWKKYESYLTIMTSLMTWIIRRNFLINTQNFLLTS